MSFCPSPSFSDEDEDDAEVVDEEPGVLVEDEELEPVPVDDEPPSAPNVPVVPPMVCEPGSVIAPEVVVVGGATTGTVGRLSVVVADVELWIVATTVWVTAFVVAEVVELLLPDSVTLVALTVAAGSTVTAP